MKPLYFRHINGRTWLNDLDITGALRSYRIEHRNGPPWLEEVELVIFASSDEPPDEIKLSIADKIIAEQT